MGVFESFVGAKVAKKSVSGKMKVRKPSGIAAALSIICFGFSILVLLMYGIIKEAELELGIAVVCGIFGFGYIILINPLLQSKKNYRIFVNGGEIQISYKNRPVLFKYHIDPEGRIAFVDDYNKINCVSYADGSRMGKVTKFRIVNYLTMWLQQRDCLSDSTRYTIE